MFIFCLWMHVTGAMVNSPCNTPTRAQAYFQPKIEQAVNALDQQLKKALDAEFFAQSREVIQQYLDGACKELDMLHDYIKTFDWNLEQFMIAFQELKKFLVIDPCKSQAERIKQLLIALDMKNILLAVCDQTDEKIEYFCLKKRCDDFCNNHALLLRWNSYLPEFLLRRNVCLMNGIESAQQRLDWLHKKQPSIWDYSCYVLPIISFGIIERSDQDVKTRTNLIDKLNELRDEDEQLERKFQWERRLVFPTCFDDHIGITQYHHFLRQCLHIGSTQKAEGILGVLLEIGDKFNPVKTVRSHIDPMITFVRDGMSVLAQNVTEIEHSLTSYKISIDDAVEALINIAQANIEQLNQLDTIMDIADMLGVQPVTRRYVISLIAHCLAKIESSETLKSSILTVAAALGKDEDIRMVFRTIHELRGETEPYGISLAQRYVSAIGMIERDRLGILIRIFLTMAHHEPERIRNLIGGSLHRVLEKVVAVTSILQQKINAGVKKCEELVQDNIIGTLTVTDKVACLNTIAAINKNIAHEDLESGIITLVKAYGMHGFLQLVKNMEQERIAKQCLERQNKVVSFYQQKSDGYKKRYNELRLPSADTMYISLKDSLLWLYTKLYIENLNSKEVASVRTKIVNIEKRLELSDALRLKESENAYQQYCDAQQHYEREQHQYLMLCKDINAQLKSLEQPKPL